MAVDPSPVIPVGLTYAFVGPVQPINSTTVYQPIGRICGVRGRKLLLEFIVGAGGAIAHLKITRAALPGGTHQPIAVDAAINTLSNDIKSVSAANVYQTAAGGDFQIVLDGAADEYAIYAMAASANTTMQLQGSAYPVGN